MKKAKGWAFVNDIDVLGDIWLDDSEENADIDNSIDDIDVLWNKEPTAPVIEETAPVVEETVVTPEEETKPDEKPEGEENEKGESDEDIEKWLDDLLKSQWEVDSKVDEVMDAAQDGWDESMVKLVSELQWLIVEKNMVIEELTKQVEVSQNRYLTKFWENEELSIYKQEIEKLQSNPRLMALVKYSDTDNEKIKPKLISILSDMIYKLTWQDVTDLLDKQDRASMSILNTPSSDSQPMEAQPEKKDENIGYDDSINNILWL